MADNNKSWFSEHPWMTFFIATGIINGIVTIVRPQSSPYYQLQRSLSPRDAPSWKRPPVSPREADPETAAIGACMPPKIVHEGRTLFPLTPKVIAEKPDLDPVQHDARILRGGGREGGWINPRTGEVHPPRLIRQICRPDDALYYWDGPWGGLSGDRGIAIVRDGRVVEQFFTLLS
jgi:hypothetical protein